jgi:hypothetical protein
MRHTIEILAGIALLAAGQPVPRTLDPSSGALTVKVELRTWRDSDSAGHAVMSS